MSQKARIRVRVRATDSDGSLTEQTFVIAINDINEVPFDLSLSSLIVLENAVVGTVVGELNASDPDADDELTYSLAVGEGDTDNSQFGIVGNELRAKQSFNFEAKSSYAVRVRATDSAGLVTEKAFGISVGNVNESPFELTASSTDVAENNIAGSVVGEFSAVDPDAGDILTFSLVAGEGDAGNSSFEIIGNELRTTESFDFESQSSYSIRVRAADSEGLYAEKVFSISISNVNEAPFDLSLSSLLVLENASAGTVVGEFEASDPDADDVLTYSLVAGEGDTDNTFFEIVSAELRATESFDFESQNSYSVRVRAVDAAGLATDKTFSIAVVNANDAPAGSVIINGIAEEGKELRATNDVADQDGLGAISYQWKRNNAGIEGAVGDRYTLSQADVGSVITVTASYTDAQGTYESVTSESTTPVLNVNNAPILDLSASPSLNSVAEDAGHPTGQVGALVSSLIDSGGTHNNFYDQDGDLAGLAIVGVNIERGGLWYSDDDGGTWQAVGVVSEDAPMFLRADAGVRVYYQPVADFTGTITDAISFKAWDRTVDYVQLGTDIEVEAHEALYGGRSVAVSADGQIVAIGATRGATAGLIRMYSWDSQDSKWVQMGNSLVGEAPWDHAGDDISLSADGKTVAIGALGNDNNGLGSGHTRVYVWDSESFTWTQRGDDIDGQASYDWSGRSVSLSSDGLTLAIGAGGHDANGENSGHTRVFSWDSASSAWVQRGSDIHGEAAKDWSGHSVSLSADGRPSQLELLETTIMVVVRGTRVFTYGTPRALHGFNKEMI